MNKKRPWSVFRLYSSIVGNPRLFTLEERIFCTFTLFIAFVFLFEGAMEWKIDGDLEALAFVVVGILNGVFYYFGRFKRQSRFLILPVLGLLQIFLWLAWFPNGGSHNSASNYYIIAIVAGLLMLKQKYRFGYLTFFIISTGVVLYLEAKHPEWVKFHASEADRFADASSSLILTLLINGLLFLALLANYNIEKSKSDTLLLNILPAKIADELRIHGKAKPVFFPSASILFTDFKQFTKIAESMKPEELINQLDQNFSKFDQIIDKFGLEKLKTIGDSYMCAAGVPENHIAHAVHTVLAALEIRDYLKIRKAEQLAEGKQPWEGRLGIHSGPLIAGVVGKKKFTYDIWGDAVNIASRCESSGVLGEVNISVDTYKLVQPYFTCEARGYIAIKNKSPIKMFIVKSLKKKYLMFDKLSETWMPHPELLGLKEHHHG